MKEHQRFLHRLGPILLLLAIVLGGCVNGQQIGEDPVGPVAWIDSPLHGSSLPLAPFEVISHASSAEGIASFELSVNDEVYAFDDAPPDQVGGTLAHLSQLWNPEVPGTYHLTMRAQDVTGVFGPPAEAEVFVGDVDDEPVEGTSEVMATPTLTPTATGEEPVECTYTALVNLFCRTGPGGGYPEIDTFIPGLSAPIVGQSSDGFYWYVIGPYNGLMCTVPDGSQYGEVSGDCGQIPMFTPIPVPPTKTPTRTPTCTPGVVGC